jgi:threonine dehydrogenase-like Zn-dependent dehydrogenase
LPGDLGPELGALYTARLHRTVMHLCATRRLDPLPLLSHVLPAAAYALIDRPPADPLQVILDFTEDMR